VGSRGGCPGAGPPDHGWGFNRPVVGGGQASNVNARTAESGPVFSIPGPPSRQALAHVGAPSIDERRVITAPTRERVATRCEESSRSVLGR
jgi:hypothetical protein